MRDQTERLEQICMKWLGSDIEDMTEREIFEMILLFADRKVEPSLREKLLERYDSYIDMLSDSEEHLAGLFKHGIILAGLAKLIRVSRGAFGGEPDKTELEKQSFPDRAGYYCEMNRSDRIRRLCLNLASRYYDPTREVFRIAFLDEVKRVITEENVAYGDFGNVYIDIQKLLRTAINREAKGILLAHNHPDGNLTPSAADIRVTERLKTACEDVGIDFVDHIIVYGGSYRSIGKKNGTCDSGRIMNLISSDAIADDGSESGIYQIGHTGAYRYAAPSDFAEEAGYRFDPDEYPEPMWDLPGDISPEDEV